MEKHNHVLPNLEVVQPTFSPVYRWFTDVSPDFPLHLAPRVCKANSVLLSLQRSPRKVPITIATVAANNLANYGLGSLGYGLWMFVVDIFLWFR